MKHHCEQIIKIPLKSDYLNAYEILVFLKNNQFDQSIGTMPQKMLKKIFYRCIEDYPYQSTVIKP